MKIICVFLVLCSSLAAAPPLNFSRDVLPTLEESCFKCHSGRNKKPKAKLRLDRKEDMLSFEGLIVPGKPDKSSLVTLIELPKGHDDVMPPPEKAPEVSEKSRQKVRLWIEQGAHFSDWKEFIDNKVEKKVSGLSAIKEKVSEKNAVDKLNELVGRALKRHNLQMNPSISDEIFLKRIFLQVIGRIPTYEEASSFIKSNDKNKRLNLIKKLQSSEGRVSHNFNYWANILRAQSAQKGNIKGAWLKYIKDSLRKNKPYDKFVKEMVTAKGSTWENPQIGFFGRDMKNRLAGYEALTGVFLGTQIGCAQCHDHPYDVTTRRDYYEMFGFIYGVNAQERRKKIFKHVDPQKIYSEINSLNKSIKDKKPAYGSLTRSMNIHAQVNFRETLFKVYTGPIKSYWRVLPNDYQYEDGKANGFAMPSVLFGENPKVKLDDDAQKIFADWLTSPDNLKFTHVIANRLWHKAFGNSLIGGLVDVRPVEQSKTPELAEYLAELMVSVDYDILAFNRILYQTELYQAEAMKRQERNIQHFINGPLVKRLSAEQVWDSLMTLIVPQLDEKISKKNPDFSFIKELIEVKTTAEFWGKIKQKSIDEPIDIGKGTRMKRMVQEKGFLLTDLKRASDLRQPTPPGHFLRQFGQADRELVEDQWSNPTIPQSLALLNSPLVKKITEDSSVLMNSLHKDLSLKEQVQYIYLSVLSRLPSSSESALILSHAEKEPNFTMKDLAWILVNTREFLFSK